MDESCDLRSPSQETALLMARSCVRDTVLEDYHTDGKISQEEMKRFNKEVVNKLYTFLDFMWQRPKEDRNNFFVKVESSLEHGNWDWPELDSQFLSALKRWDLSEFRSELFSDLER